MSLNQVFRSCDRPITEPGKGRYWSVDISKGEGYKRERRRKRRNAAPYNGTRDLPGGIGNQLVDSSDGDQDMDDGASSSRSLKAKKGKGVRRGPYTRLTLGQPSIPGTTGITAGGASAAASISPVGGTPPAGTPPPSSTPVGELGYPTSIPMGSAPPPQQAQASSSSSGLHHHHHSHSQHHSAPHASTITTSTNPQPMTASSSSSAIGATATASSSSTSYLAQSSYYQQHHSTSAPPPQTSTSYFSHSHTTTRLPTIPTFGQPSFPSSSTMYGSAEGRFGPEHQHQQSSSSYMHTTTRDMGHRSADAISVSSDSSGSPELDRMSM